MTIAQNIIQFKNKLPKQVQLIAVTKTHPVELITEAYQSGHKIFGENKVQELVAKHQHLPKDIQWHLIGHLQSNKVKYIAPFVSLIHSVDSIKLLEEINKQAAKNNRVIDCLLQVYIAAEETKFGLSFPEVEQLLGSDTLKHLTNVCITGLMGMASNTNNKEQVRNEFKSLKIFFEKIKINYPQLSILSMGMSSDYDIAIEEGSTMIRVGSLLFGERNYAK